MKSVIIISPLKNELSRIQKIWRKNGRSEFVSDIIDDSVSLEFKENQYIIVDYLKNGAIHYNNSQLHNNILQNYSFYTISYSTKNILIYFMFFTNFSSLCYIDNDHGDIIKLDLLSIEFINDFLKD